MLKWTQYYHKLVILPFKFLLLSFYTTSINTLLPHLTIHFSSYLLIPMKKQTKLIKFLLPTTLLYIATATAISSIEHL